MADTLQVVKNKNDNDFLFKSTAVFIVLDKEIIGAILLEDEVRFGSKEAILKIRSMELHPIMLTGDNETIAARIANESGIEEFYADLLPEDKVSKIKDLILLRISLNGLYYRYVIIFVTLSLYVVTFQR